MLAFTFRNGRARGGGRRRTLLTVGVSLAVELAGLRLRGYRFGGNVVVRCRKGHLFMTIWIPSVSIKSLRLGWWRLQHCPVGRHWSIVSPVDRSTLTDQELRAADQNRDIRIP
ncbi:MAG: hypothetical protein ACLQBB_08140 [Solirubrobacteraceae bacterium]